LIYVDVKKAMDEDIPFYISRQGLIITPGDRSGFLGPHLFHTVERISKKFYSLAGRDSLPSQFFGKENFTPRRHVPAPKPQESLEEEEDVADDAAGDHLEQAVA
jgi:hypothetical protein